jgi:hypothetical protein
VKEVGGLQVMTKVIIINQKQINQRKTNVFGNEILCENTIKKLTHLSRTGRNFSRMMEVTTRRRN